MFSKLLGSVFLSFGSYFPVNYKLVFSEKSSLVYKYSFGVLKWSFMLDFDVFSSVYFTII